MNLIPALGTYAAMLREDGLPLTYTGGAPNLMEAVDADLLARAIKWAGEAPAARDQAFNITNGDVFLWRSVWPAIANALGMQLGGDAPFSLALEMPPRAQDWERIRAKYRLVSPPLADFVGLSFQYADSCLGYDDERRGDPALVSAVKLRQAGFHEFIDTEMMLRKWFRIFQENGTSRQSRGLRSSFGLCLSFAVPAGPMAAASRATLATSSTSSRSRLFPGGWSEDCTPDISR
jgi:hypothetical protein